MHKNKKESLKARNLMQKDLSRLLRKDLDMVLLQEVGEGLLFEIFKKGKVVFERDAQKHHIFRSSRLMRCMDFRFYQDRMQRGMIQSIKRSAVG